MRKITTIFIFTLMISLTIVGNANADTPLYYKDTYVTDAEIIDGVSVIDVQEVCNTFNAKYSYIPVANAVAIDSGANQILIYKNKVIMSNHESEVFVTSFDLIGTTNSGGATSQQVKVPLKPVSFCFSNGDIMYDENHDRILMESGKLYQEYLENSFNFKKQNMVKVFATNYYGGPGIEGGPTTATGKDVEWGVIAIDPNYAKDVMYLGGKVRLWNEDGTCLGEFSCEDTGGAIKGARIDIAHDSAEDMQNFGNRYVYVEAI